MNKQQATSNKQQATSNKQQATSNKHTDVLSFSGGRTSAYFIDVMKRRNPECKYIYCDTGAEHPKTYEFIKRVVKEFEIDLICLRAKFNPVLGKGNSYEVVPVDSLKHDLSIWEAMIAKYSTPYMHGAFCTDMMKGNPFYSYCDDHYGEGEYTTWLGIRYDEPKRLKPKDGIRYLAELDDSDKFDILDWWMSQSFDLDLPEHLGNCVFCLKKGVNKIALAAKDEPELSENFISVIESDSVRKSETRNLSPEIMYRGNNSLRSIISMYTDTPRDELASTIRSQKRYDSGSCSESCEAFSCQLDLF